MIFTRMQVNNVYNTCARLTPEERGILSEAMRILNALSDEETLHTEWMELPEMVQDLSIAAYSIGKFLEEIPKDGYISVSR